MLFCINNVDSEKSNLYLIIHLQDIILLPLSIKVYEYQNLYLIINALNLDQ
jgi:hypothetical protein